MADLVGKQIGNYRLTRLLGRGGFASMYLAEHMFTKDQVAIEVLPTRPTGKDLDNFLAEARLTSRLVHPHILRTLDFGVENDFPFIVTAYATNGSLRQRHPRGSIVPLDTVVSYVRQVAEALQYAHDQGIIHRDVKPESMLLGYNDEVLLSDFGIAVVVPKTPNQTARGIAGTPAYMAPEQFQGRPSYASDQYSLGIVVYEWLCGELPFNGSDIMQLAFQHMNVPPLSLRKKVPAIPPAVERVVMRALAKDPQQRFDTVQAFANALDQDSKFAQSTSAAQPPSVSPKEQMPPVAPSIDKCPYCGAETRPGDNFCLSCGNRLLAATPSFGDATVPGSDNWSTLGPPLAPAYGSPIAPASSDHMVAESATGRDDILPTTKATLDKVENPARLIVRDDKGDVLQEHRLEKPETVIGRAPASDILLSKDKLTSRRHAVVRYEDGQYVLSDERSANGTFVNGQQLEELTPRILKDGDHVGIGEHELIFHFSTGVENLPTIAVPPEKVAAPVPQEATYRTHEDKEMTPAGSNDFGTRSMNGDGAAGGGVPVTPVPQPVAVVDSVPPARTSTPAGDSPANSDTGVTFNRLISLVQPTLREDASSQDTTKVLSLFAIARTTLEEDNRAFVGKVYSVEAGISQSKPEGFAGEPFKLPLRSSIRFIFLDILLHTSSNIELISHWQRRLRYDSHNPEPQLVAFKFRAVAPERSSVTIDFYYERRWLQTIRFEFNAVEQSQLTAISSEG